jgi:hypothetical protein
MDLCAQGTTVFRTGGGQPLVTFSQTLNVPAGPVSPLFLEFGFATDEVLSPSKILDSLTVSLQSAVSPKTAILVTADASGVVWAPLTPGTVQIDPAAIAHSVTAFPDLQPVLANAIAFKVSVQIPEALLGASLEVIFDLYDNQDVIASMGYVTGLAIPEPSVPALALCGALAWWCGRRRP